MVIFLFCEIEKKKDEKKQIIIIIKRRKQKIDSLVTGGKIKAGTVFLQTKQRGAHTQAGQRAWPATY